MLPVDNEQLAIQAASELPYITNAYEQLLHNNRKSMIAFATRFLGSREDAEDVVQEVSLKVFFALKNYVSQGNFKTWLFQIVKNESFNKTLQRKKHFTSELNDEVLGEEHLSYELIHANHKDKLQKALLSLSNEERQIVLLRHLSGFQFQEISQITGLSESGVKMKCIRATEKLNSLE